MAFQQNRQKRNTSQYAASICSSWGTADPVTVARQLLSPPPNPPSTLYSECIAKTASQSTLTVSEALFPLSGMVWVRLGRHASFVKKKKKWWQNTRPYSDEYTTLKHSTTLYAFLDTVMVFDCYFAFNSNEWICKMYKALAIFLFG